METFQKTEMKFLKSLKFITTPPQKPTPYKIQTDLTEN